VVKGVCGYADSHKKKAWQEYAALATAACTKAVLEQWSKKGEAPADQVRRFAIHLWRVGTDLVRSRASNGVG
jgi:hypothetical protein